MNLATNLDPRYKELPFLRKRIVVGQVEDELIDMQPQPPPEALEEAPQDETEEPCTAKETEERPRYQPPW